MSEREMKHTKCAFVYGLGLPLVLGAGVLRAQPQPATIPTVVAQAMSFEPEMLGRPRFFDGRTPPDWPAAIVPSGARIVGGGVVGDSAMYRMRVTVFEFPAGANPNDVLTALLARAGFANSAPEPTRTSGGGFMETASPLTKGRFCQASTLATFGPLDSARAPLVVAIYLLDGEAGRLNCSPAHAAPMPQHFPVTVPPLSPPVGVMAIGASSGWGSSGGDMKSTLRTTMPADSILAHYSRQLVAGGWKTDGGPAANDGVGVQRFTFREGQDNWRGTLIILVATGDRREVLLEVTRAD
jgi:hypothetical protein